jgi:dethiobiotin synthetase
VRGLFITATDTGVGKSVLSAALLAAIAATGEDVHAYKPALTGLDEDPDQTWPRDHELLAGVTRQDPEEVAPLRFGPAVSPHLAAQLAGTPIEPAGLVQAAERIGAAPGATLVVEGVGGLLVPLGERYLVRDLAAALGLPLVIAARPGLGTLNHTLLTLESARAAGLRVAAVVLTPWPAQPDEIERSNLATLRELGGVEVATLASIDGPSSAALARAGAQLPWRAWLGAS